jgi:outer membrane receptor for ferrienterochelin and colicins
MKFKIFFAMLLLWSVASWAVAHTNAHIKDANSICGHVIVKDTEENLSDAIVVIEETKQRVVSNADGKFVFRDLPAGDYTLTVFLVGY